MIKGLMFGIVLGATVGAIAMAVLLIEVDE